eukprot:TRINITY_DN13878_c0_g1_i1.p1 TRINITY_DN13878_c0_g1~~TRINITY_DN13878_c0_g1_i1.p1  ORF type:complete len:778 (-),score=92.44 TRINITY_DN13878_c0_g1_i1:7-2340(-)
MAFQVFLWSAVSLLVACHCKLIVPDAPFLQDTATRFTFGSGPQLADWKPIPDIQQVTHSAFVTNTSAFLLLGPSTLHQLETRSLRVRRIDTDWGLTITPGMTMGTQGDQFALASPAGVWRCQLSQGPPCAFAPVTGLGPNVSAVVFDAADTRTVWIGGGYGLFSATFIGPNRTDVAPVAAIHESVTAVATDPITKQVAAGTATLLWRTLPSGQWHFFRTPGIIDDAITSLAFDANGALWIGNNVCINVMHSNYTFQRLGYGVNGLPYANVTSLSAVPLPGTGVAVGSSSPVVYAGTAMGAMRHEENNLQTSLGLSSWKYYYGPRWLPQRDITQAQFGRVVSVSSGRDGGNNEVAVFVTPLGLTFLRRIQFTLLEKAEHYENMMSRHDLYGQVGDCHATQWGNPAANCTQGSNDNNGLWSSLYLASQCFRYALSGRDPTIKAEAWRRFEAMEFLNNVTGIEGLPARSFLRSSDQLPGDGHWHNSTAYLGWVWKGDTSSDEIAGHLFVYPIVYDLLAETPTEKARAYRLLYGITKYIVDNKYYLIDVTGKPTTWGKWAPEYVNDNPDWYDQRGLNSLQIMTWLLSAYRVSKDDIFLNAFTDLAENYGYALNIINQKITQPSDDNYSDDELAFLPYHLYSWTGLPQMAKEFQLSIDRAMGISLSERSSLWNFIYGSTNPANGFDLQGALWTLQNWPLDMVSWETDNTHRLDLHMDTEADRFGDPVTTNLLPYDERNFDRWNSNPFEIKGGDGFNEPDPAVWLLPYWMARYYGFISSPNLR